ncbi:hypothetical protein C7441_112140 [Pseudaminobacter salicylatoxidans]|uniref:Uncharacterized protein n=1 Tax=Pseudaminobacter salicylatoxidans TaxID=93369 RepID=A0A316C161_PSESE|nr:hypothetical protein [Pseudaminobacter salicylatoxidans]PWJ80598.1 hypothetical protein C7441_112140 [Pseudaminobacter salicylatoxidans]
MRPRICGPALFIIVAGCVAAPPPPTSSAQITAKYGGTETIEDGFKIARYPDGSAHVSPRLTGYGWSIDCRVDAMTDKRDCNISSKTGGPFVYYGSAASPQSVCIMGHDFPGRHGMIRVDSDAPIQTDNEGCVAAASILPQMKTGSSMTTRRYEWPYDYTRDETISLDGFAKAIEVVHLIRGGR